MEKNSHIDPKAVVKKLHEETELAIAMRRMSEKFTYDERINDSFHDTYEAHGFNLVQASLVYVLALTLMRIHDTSERSDIYSLRNLFKEILPTSEETNRLGDRASLFEEARNQYKQLRESHLLSRTKTLRDRFIAHAGMLTGEEQLPKYQYLDDFTDKTVSLMEKLSISVLDTHPSYDEVDDIWKKYASKFFDSLIQGQLVANTKPGQVEL
ncbi:MAG: hypothetical protein BMS9Abin02_1862 [Anaerolineae bacterium]|nr:MAG: hypothetical protein BMS9Abin02_1862 [Anaerolineae bacterium]